MKYILTVATFLFVISNSYADKKVNWLSWDEAITAAKKNPKKIYIDIYTDWCGYCKKMDRETFSDPKVIKYLNENFYPVKFDAEQKEAIDFNGTEFKHRPGGRGGVHELAVALLNNQMGYPAFVILDEEFSRILISPGFKGPSDVMMEMEFANNETYKVKSWNAFKAEFVAKQRMEAAKANPVKPTAPTKPATPAKRNTTATPAKPSTPAKSTNTTTRTTKPSSKGVVHPEATASKYENEVYKVVEDMPRFPGCEDKDMDKNEKSKCSKQLMLEFIYKNLKYPKAAKAGNIEGQVIVQYEVASSGEIQNARVLRDIGGNCGEEALRVVKKMPTWIPGKQRGRAVNVQYTLPIKFSLSNDVGEEVKPLSKKELKKKQKEEKKQLKLKKPDEKM